LDPTINLIAITGKAGTGKTLVALAAAIHQKNKPYKEILVARPAMEMSDKTLGFLPGSKEEKIDPYMMPIYDNLAVIKEKIEPDKNQEVHEPIREWARANQIEVLVLNYIRGRSLS
jgi:PhoH-like ATPase